jgi:hypothetical protein
MEDPTDDKFTCEALVCQSAVAHRCKKAVLMGRTRCPEHEFWKPPLLQNKPVLTRIETESKEIYFVDSLGNAYTAEYERVGQYLENLLTLFEIEDEDEYA